MDQGPYGNVYIIFLSILGTIIIMVISAMYTIRNIKRIWSLGNVKNKKRANPVVNVEKKDCTNDINDCQEEEEKEEQEHDGEEDKKNDVVSNNLLNATKGTCSEVSEATNDYEADPLQYCQHIPSEVKKAKQRITMKKIQLTDMELEEERAIQRRQLEDMFDLMKTQGDKFGLSDINEMKQQMNLYSIN